MLRGLVDITREQDEDSKITVKIFKHPAHGVENGYDYSFGIKVGVGGFISDSSGWLIFHDCATDYSGNSGHYHQLCMDEIENHKEKNAVEAEELVYENKIFTKFLTDKGISMDHEKVVKSMRK